MGSLDRKRFCADLATASAQHRDKRVFERWSRGSDLIHLEVCALQRLACDLLARLFVFDHDVEAVAETLRILYPGHLMEKIFGLAQIVGSDHETAQAEAVAQFARRARLMYGAFIHESDMGATFGFVEVRRRHDDCDSLTRKVGQGVPEFPARDGIDAGRRLIQQQHLGFDDQSTCQRQLLLHAAAQPSSKPIFETVHAEHRKVTRARALRFVPWKGAADHPYNEGFRQR